MSIVRIMTRINYDNAKDKKRFRITMLWIMRSLKMIMPRIIIRLRITILMILTMSNMLRIMARFNILKKDKAGDLVERVGQRCSTNVV